MSILHSLVCVKCGSEQCYANSGRRNLSVTVLEQTCDESIVDEGSTAECRKVKATISFQIELEIPSRSDSTNQLLFLEADERDCVVRKVEKRLQKLSKDIANKIVDAHMHPQTNHSVF